MKKESRVFVSRCKGSFCGGLVLRLYSIDGFVFSTNGCKDLCKRLKEDGYFYEVSHYDGDCKCDIEEEVNVDPKFVTFLLNLLDEFEKFYKNAGGGV